jgi:hypothetical protein
MTLTTPRVFAVLATAGAIAAGSLAASTSNADSDGPLTARKHQADIAARHDVATHLDPTRVQTIR